MRPEFFLPRKAAAGPSDGWRFLMNERLLILALCATGVTMAGCSGADAPGSATASSSGASGSQLPRTEWGDPDLQGMWPIGHLAGNVPLQRPAQFGDRLHLTDEEYAAREQQIAQRSQTYEREIQGDRIGMGHWAESMATAAPQRQTSLIVDPPDGQLPALTEEGERVGPTMGSTWFRNTWDGVEDFDTWDRCITRGMPASMFPFQYNNGIQIVQSPGFVVINLEMIHEARVIPVDGRPHLPETMTTWLGDSRGRWEGDTLVIETKNFNGIPEMVNIGTSGAPRRSIPTSTELHIVERLTRIDADTIEYEVTVTDPVMMTRPWTASFTWERDPGYTFFEYACHEGNTAIRYYIETSRYERQAAAQGNR
jgi:hypothetical protein